MWIELNFFVYKFQIIITMDYIFNNEDKYDNQFLNQIIW